MDHASATHASSADPDGASDGPHSGDAQIPLRLRLVSRTRVFDAHGRELLGSRTKARAVLAVLALSDGRAAPRSLVASLLWSRNTSPDERFARLRAEVYQVRQELRAVGVDPGDVLEAEQEWLALRAGRVQTDLGETAAACRHDAWDLGTAREVCADLDRLDPALAAWLAGRRAVLDPWRHADGGTRGADVEGGRRGVGPATLGLGAVGTTAPADPDGSPPPPAPMGRPPTGSPGAPASGAPVPLGGVRPPGLADAQTGFAGWAATDHRPARGAVPGWPPARRAVLAVRPFGVGGADVVPGGGVFAQLAEALPGDLADALSRLRWLSVTLPGGPGVGAPCGADLLLEGEVRALGSRVRVTARLLHAADGALAWSGRFEADAPDALLLDDRLVASVAAQVDVEMAPVEASRVARLRAAAEATWADDGAPSGPPGPPTDAYELVLRAIPAFGDLRKETFAAAGGMLGRAVRLDPGCAAAQAWLALYCVFLVGQGWARDRGEALATAGSAAARAVALDPLDARALAVAGHVRAFLHNRPREGLELHARALQANPNLPFALLMAGVARCYVGDLEQARATLERCRALAPRDPNGALADNALAMVELLSGRHAEAAALGRRVTEVRPTFTTAYKTYLSALGHLGRHADRDADAADARRRLLELEPGFSVRRFREDARFSGPGHTEHYAAGLRLVGVPAASSVRG